MKNALLLAAVSILGFVSVAYAADVNVSQSNQQFSEDSLKMKAGDTIVFKNADTVSHNIQIVNSDGDADDKGLQKPGETIKATMAKAGDYKVRCGIHPGMKIKVTVE